jgi:hypothetical protein
MKKTLIWITMTASLGLNAAFVGGYFFAEHRAERVSRGGAAEIVMERLRLNEAQKKLFLTLRGKAHLAFRQLSDEEVLTVEAYWRELLRPKANILAIKSVVEKSAGQRVQFNMAISALLHELLSTLDPSQRDLFVSTLRRRNLFAGRFLFSGGTPPRD